MPAIAIRKTVYDGMTAKQKTLIKWVLARLNLGNPAVYKTPTAVQWYIFDGQDIDLVDLAALGTFAANFTRITNWSPPLDSYGNIDATKVRKQLRTFLAANMNTAPPPAGTANPWQWTLTNNGAPAALQAADSVPATWTPVVA